ncbi:MAG: glycosyltransferase [Clostridia bacterium]|nr:glycosyltransferase [Clostridia bacterium]
MFKISVIVPVYKAEKYLPACLKSISEQTVFGKIQLILVDDGSPDSCGKICDEFASAHANTVVIHKKNGGVSAARNAGLDVARGEYIGFVDADDTVAPDYYEKLLAAIENSGSDMAFGAFTLVFRGEHRPSAPWSNKNVTVTPSAFAERMLDDGSQNSVWSKLFRASVIKENKIYFPFGIKIGEDKLFVLNFLKHCSWAVSAEGNGYFYRDVGSSAMHSDKKMQELLSVYDIETEVFVRLGIDRQTVVEKKAVFLFGELADFLQRCYAISWMQARRAVKEAFGDEELMAHMDKGLDYVRKNNGRIYNMLADAFGKRNVTKTLLTLAIQNIITKIGERK